MSFSPVDGAVPDRVSTESGGIVYRDVWPGISLRYDVHLAGVRETALVETPDVPSRLEFSLAGLAAARVEPATGNALELREPGSDKAVAVVPLPVVKDAAGKEIPEAPFFVSLTTTSGSDIVLTMDPEWLKRQSPDAFPLQVDPDIVFPDLAAATAFSSLNNQYNSAHPLWWGDHILLGRDTTGETWRGAPRFDGLGQWSPTYKVENAYLIVQPLASDNMPLPYTVAFHAPATQSFAGAAPGGQPFATHVFQNRTDPVWVDVTSWAALWFLNGQPSGTFGITGLETGEHLERFSVTLLLDIAEPATPTTVTSPAAGGTVGTRTPLLTAAPIQSNNPDPIRYKFEVSSGPAAGSGAVITSGWVEDPQWRVPDGSLDDNTTYSTRVLTSTSSLAPSEGPPVSFKVDLNLGAGGPAPTSKLWGESDDSATVPAPSPGTGVTKLQVNTASGNLAASVEGHTVTGVAGAITPTFTYNSLARGDEGLRGEYFQDVDQDKAFDDPLVGERVDPVVAFDWASSKPIGDLQPVHMLARWTGFVRLPTGTSWQVAAVTGPGGTTQQGSRISINGQVVTPPQSWAGQPGPWWSTSVSSTSTATPVSVEYWHGTGGDASIRLYVRDASAADPDATIAEIPSDWLTTNPTTLPPGWTLATDAPTVRWLRLRDNGPSVTAIAGDGSSLEFLRNSAGYDAPGESTAILSAAPGGGYQIEDGLQYTYDPAGRLTAVVSPLDPVNPSTFSYSYTNGRLSAITDRASNPALPAAKRSVRFFYGGDPECAAAPATSAPTGLLCRIKYWDDNQTTIVYTTGRIATIIARGDERYDFSWNGSDNLVAVRDPLANDAVAAGVRTSNATTRTSILWASGPSGSISPVEIVAPAATATAVRTRHTYVYGVGETTEQICGGVLGSCSTNEGFVPTSGFYRKTRYDARGRIVEEVDAAGRTSTTAWNDAFNKVFSTVDPAGLRTTTLYDHAGRATDQWGPAPASLFTPEGLPQATTQIPHTHTGYDEGLSGLATRYWDTPNRTGPVGAQTLGLTAPSGSLFGSWTSPPVGTDNSWSLRSVGTLNAPTTGAYGFELQSSGPTKVFIDGTLAADFPDNPFGFLAFNLTLAEGAHSVRLDYAPSANATTRSVILRWQPPGQSQAIVPGSNLAPGYGLTTSTTDPDGRVTTFEYRDDATGIRPYHKLQTASTKDPAGQNLRETTTYEPPGATSLLRRTARTSPGLTTNSYAYYGQSEAPLTNTCGLASAVDQRSQLKQRTFPDPDGTGGPQEPRVEQYLYDSAGRTVGTRSATQTLVSSTGWTCTSFDTRGRPTQKTVPARGPEPARTITYSYAVAANPLIVSQTDSSGSIAVAYDLIGRITSYTDAQNATTTTTYDALGRVTTTTGPNGTTTSTYETGTGRPDLTKLNSVTVADNSYDTAGRLSGVGYGNSTTASFGFDALGRAKTSSYTGPGSTLIAGDDVTRSLGGRVTDQLTDTGASALVDFNPSGPNYLYDGAGRLVAAARADHWLSYGFNDTPFAGCNGNQNAGKNTNRESIRQVYNEGDGATLFCYDNADRLLSAGSELIGYDDYGNTTSHLGETLGYDGANRQTNAVRERQAVLYSRDPADRIIERRSYGTVDPPRTLSVGYTSPTTSGMLYKPSGLPDQTLLLAVVTLPTGTTTTPPSGWTNVAATTTGAVNQYIWRRTSPSGDTTMWPITFSASTTAAVAVMAIIGADPANPIDNTTLASTTAPTTSQDFPAVNAGGEGRLALRIESLNAAVTATPPAGTYEHLDVTATTVAHHVFTQTRTAAGTVPAATATTSTAAAGHHRSITINLTRTTTRYRYAGPTDAPAIITDQNNAILDKAISLPGGVIRNERPDGTRWSYPNLHGDIIATANNTGTKLGPTITYDPDGNTGPTRPDTLTGELEPTYLGQHGKLQEQPVSPFATGIIQMGARLYNPNWGRFLSIDPIEGGCANDYTYGHGDPINGTDLTGKWWIFDDIGRFLSKPKNQCLILLGGSIALGIGAVIASGGTALALGLGGAALGIAAPLAVGNTDGAIVNAFTAGILGFFGWMGGAALAAGGGPAIVGRVIGGGFAVIGGIDTGKGAKSSCG